MNSFAPILLMLRFFLAIVLLTGSAEKLLDIGIFTGQVRNYRLLPDALVQPFALLFPATEIGAALLLFFSATSIPVIAVLLAATLGVMINLQRGRTHIDCGCGGPAGQPISGFILGRNILLMMLAWLSARHFTFNLLSGLDVSIALLGGMTMSGFYFAANQLVANQLRMHSERT